MIDRQPTGASIGRGGGIETPTRTISDLVDDYGFLRNLMTDLVDDTRNLHRLVDERHSDGLDAELRVGAGERAKQPLDVLLAELSDLGFSWRDIARVAGHIGARLAQVAARRCGDGREPPQGCPDGQPL